MWTRYSGYGVSQTNLVLCCFFQVMEAMKKYGVRQEDEEGMEKGEREVAEMQFPALERMLAVSESACLVELACQFLSIFFDGGEDGGSSISVLSI